MGVLPTSLIAACGLTDLVVALLIVLAPWRPAGRLSIVRAPFAFAGVAAVFVVRTTVLSRLGLNSFGVMHLLYLDLVAVIPATAAALLAVPAWRRRLTTAARAVAIAGLLPAAVGVDATFIEPFRLRVETAEVVVPPSRVGSSPLRVAVLTDLQTRQVTEYERSAIDRLMALRPDLILIPGDLLQVPAEDFEDRAAAVRDLLGRLSAPGGVFLVQGDVDGPPTRLLRLIEGTAIRPLLDETATVTIGDRRVTIGGVLLNYRTESASDVIRGLAEAPDDGSIRLLLAHRPDVVLGLPSASRIDLTVAGHTHGGQVVIPGFGPPITLSRVPRAVAAGGLHPVDGNLIYVSRGVGCERDQAPRIRLFCPPEISLLTIRSR